MTTITLERAFMIRVLEQLDVAQALLERSQHHAKIAAMYEELRAALAPPTTAPEPSTEVAVGKLCKSLREDLDYAWTWHCNIAMAAFDAGCPHDVANEGAARFMQLLAGVDTREHPAFQGTQDHPMRNDKTAPAQPAPERKPDAETVALIKACRAAFSEELSAYDIDPPISHVKQGYDDCNAWLKRHGVGEKP